MNAVRRFWWLVLYAAFVGAAVLLRNWVEQNGVAEIWGWDYATFVGQISDWRWIGYFGFRHPGLGVICSPLVVLQHIWGLAYLFVMPAVATATAWLVWRMAGWLALMIWLTFPTTWLLAGVPESFPLAQLALVVSAYSAQKWRGVSDTSRQLWSVLFAGLNGAVTLTNCVKPLLAYVSTCGSWKKATKVVGAVIAFVSLGVGFFAIRSYMTGRGIGAGLEATLAWIPETRDIPHELYGFFIRPVGLVQSLVVYPLVVLSIIRLLRAHNTFSLFTFTSYFAVDACIHGVIGWGMSEPWVFAPHWIWMLPLVVGAANWRGVSDASRQLSGGEA